MHKILFVETLQMPTATNAEAFYFQKFQKRWQSLSSKMLSRNHTKARRVKSRNIALKRKYPCDLRTCESFSTRGKCKTKDRKFKKSTELPQNRRTFCPKFIRLKCLVRICCCGGNSYPWLRSSVQFFLRKRKRCGNQTQLGI